MAAIGNESHWKEQKHLENTHRKPIQKNTENPIPVEEDADGIW